MPPSGPAVPDLEASAQRESAPRELVPVPKNLQESLIPESPVPGPTVARETGSAVSQVLPPQADMTGAEGLLSPSEQAALGEIRKRSQGTEVICIIRSGDPQAQSEIIVLENVSSQFVQQLTQADRLKKTPQLTSLQLPTHGGGHRPVRVYPIEARTARR